jgi:threonine dehydrogenase-like Zn-dependent dehydrogenase
MRAVFFQRSMPKIITTLALKKLWSNAVYAPTAPLAFKALPEPPLPGPKGVRVRNEACGICASDLHIAYVDIDPMVHPAALPGDDRIFLGHEVVSTVEEVGPEVTSLQPGDKVLMQSRFLGPTCSSQDIAPPCGHCAQGNYVRCENRHADKGEVGIGGGWGDGYTAHEAELWKLPDGLTQEQALLIEPFACSLRAVLRRLPAPGDKVLVVGCGIIGLGVLQCLRAAAPEADVYALARYPQQIERAESYGATVLGKGDVLEMTAETTGASLFAGDFGNRTLLGGFDLIIDCVGNGNTIQQSLRMARAGGAVNIVGVNLHTVKVDLTPVWHQEVTLLGAVGHGMDELQGEAKDSFARVAEWFLEGKLNADKLITHRFRLEDWKEAMQTSSNKKSGCIKVIFDYE